MREIKLSECGSALQPLCRGKQPLFLHNKWMVSCDAGIPDITASQFIASLARWVKKESLESVISGVPCGTQASCHGHMIYLSYCGSAMPGVIRNGIHSQIYTFAVHLFVLIDNETIALPHCTIPRYTVSVPIRSMEWSRYVYRYLPRHIRNEISTCYLLATFRVKHPNLLGILPNDVIYYMFHHLIMD